MANFIVRVELHGATSDDYTKLHADMELAGFKRTIISSNRTTLQLPTAEYVISSFADGESIRDAAYNVAIGVCRDSRTMNQNGKSQNPSVIAAEFLNLSWRNLDEVR